SFSAASLSVDSCLPLPAEIIARHSPSMAASRYSLVRASDCCDWPCVYECPLACPLSPLWAVLSSLVFEFASRPTIISQAGASANSTCSLGARSIQAAAWRLAGCGYDRFIAAGSKDHSGGREVGDRVGIVGRLTQHPRYGSPNSAAVCLSSDSRPDALSV